MSGWCINQVKGNMRMLLFCLTAGLQEESSRCSSGSLDDGLFVRMAQGDKKALEQVYRATDKAVFGFALSILHNAADAEDVMQETYVRLFQCAGQYVPQGKPLAWILTIVKNLARMKLREQGRRAYTPLEDIEEAVGDFSSADAEDRLVLDAAMTILGEQERQILLLHAVAGLKHREIAALLDRPLATVLSKYNRALKKLKNHLKISEV